MEMSELVFDKWDLEKAQDIADIMALYNAMTPEDQAEMLRFARELLARQEHD